MLWASFILATATAAPGGGKASEGSMGAMILQMLPFLFIFVFFYIFMIRGPMKKQEQEKQRLFAALKENDRVVTSGGIIGTISSINKNEDEATLKVDEKANVRIKVLKSSIVRILNGKDQAKESKDGAASA